MRILAISDSLRAASSNTEVLKAAQRLAPTGLEVVLYAGLGRSALIPTWTNPSPRGRCGRSGAKSASATGCSSVVPNTRTVCPAS
jgi:hypothetical protein